MIIFYHQIKTPIGFLYRLGLNFRSLIQPLETQKKKKKSLETLPIELTETHILFTTYNLTETPKMRP